MSAIRRVAIGAALVVGMVVASAPAASAHAVLLRTVPSPQTTVTPPTAIRLEFSEPVEVAFGAVRLFDVDGHRMDSGRSRRADGNRDVDVPVPRLKDGTYTVTWRAVSADGHPVWGGFDFYVGAPSTISAVAVRAEHGAGPVVGWGYGLVRFAWFASLVAVLGMVAARRWVWTPAVRAAGLGDSPAATTFRRRFGRALPSAWLVLALAGGLTIVFQAASASGLPLTSSARPAVLAEVLHTTFGRIWLAQVALTLAALVPVAALVRARPLLGVAPPAWIALLAALGLGLCLTAGLSGHARTEGHPVVAVPSVAVHLAAVAVWVGGLGALVVLGGRAWRSLPADQRAGLLGRLVPRFSRLAVAAVAVVVATGMVNSLGNLAAVSDLWRLTYGRVLAAKVALLAVALALAARHLWVTPGRLARPQTATATVASFQRSAAAELGVMVATVALAAGLVALVPGRSLALAARGPVNAERRAGGYTVQLFIDPSAVGANQVHVTFVDPRGLGAAEVTNAAVALGPVGSALAPVPVRLISAGHFVGDVTLPAPGRYRLSAATGPGPGGASTTFRFRLRSSKAVPR